MTQTGDVYYEVIRKMADDFTVGAARAVLANCSGMNDDPILKHMAGARDGEESEAARDARLELYLELHEEFGDVHDSTKLTQAIKQAIIDGILAVTSDGTVTIADWPGDSDDDPGG